MKNNIGTKIKELRKTNNMTQKQLAECLSKSERMIQKYESGDVQPSIKILKEISNKFKTDIKYFLIIEEDEVTELGMHQLNLEKNENHDATNIASELIDAFEKNGIKKEDISIEKLEKVIQMYKIMENKE